MKWVSHISRRLEAWPSWPGKRSEPFRKITSWTDDSVWIAKFIFLQIYKAEVGDSGASILISLNKVIILRHFEKIESSQELN